jgi:hypothetical protein
VIRKLLSCVLALALATSALAQQRYNVTLKFDADDDAEAVTRQIAATYRLQIDPPDIGASTLTVTATEAAAAMLQHDRRVVAVEVARPQLTQTNAQGFGEYAYDGAGSITKSATTPSTTTATDASITRRSMTSSRRLRTIAGATSRRSARPTKPISRSTSIRRTVCLLPLMTFRAI